MSKSERRSSIVRDALFAEWDPIGVKSVIGAEDEYDAYVGEICALLAQHPTVNQIFHYLWALETQHMGLDGDRLNTEAFARRLYLLSQDAEC